MNNKIGIFDFLNDVSHNKKNILSDDNENQYNPFMMNRWLSMRIDTIMYSQEMNVNSHLPKRMQYDYYFYSLKKMKRNFSYIKHTRHEDVELLRKYYSCSESKAKEILKLHSQNDMEYIKKKLYRGGVSK